VTGISQGSVYQQEIGQAPTFIEKPVFDNIDFLTVRNGIVFLPTDHGIETLRLTDRNSQQISGLGADVIECICDDRIYFSAGNGRYSIPTAGGEAPTSLGTGWTVGCDDSYLYAIALADFYEFSWGVHDLVKIPKAGGDPILLMPDAPIGASYIVSSDSIYALDGGTHDAAYTNGGLLRIAK